MNAANVLVGSAQCQRSGFISDSLKSEPVALGPEPQTRRDVMFIPRIFLRTKSFFPLSLVPRDMMCGFDEPLLVACCPTSGCSTCHLGLIHAFGR